MKTWLANIFRPSPRRTCKTLWRSFWLHCKKRGCKTVATANEAEARSRRTRKGAALRFMRHPSDVQRFAAENNPRRKQQCGDVERGVQAIQSADAPRQRRLVEGNVLAQVIP